MVDKCCLTSKAGQGSIIYVAGPAASYAKPHRLQALTQIRELAEPHGVHVFAPESHWKTGAQRRQGWTDLCPLLGELVIVANTDRTIDAQTTQEAAVARACGIAVSYWTPTYLIPWGAFELEPLTRGTTRRAARIVIVRGEVLA